MSASDIHAHHAGIGSPEDWPRRCSAACRARRVARRSPSAAKARARRSCSSDRAEGCCASGEGPLKDPCGGLGVVAPRSLVGEIAEEGSAHVAVAALVSAVKSGDPVLAGLWVQSQVEAVPGNGLGQSCGQCVQAEPDRLRAAAVFEQVGDGPQVSVEQRRDMWALFRGRSLQPGAGLLQQRDQVFVYPLARVLVGSLRQGWAAAPPLAAAQA